MGTIAPTTWMESLSQKWPGLSILVWAHMGEGALNMGPMVPIVSYVCMPTARNGLTVQGRGKEEINNKHIIGPKGQAPRPEHN